MGLNPGSLFWHFGGYAFVVQTAWVIACFNFVFSLWCICKSNGVNINPTMQDWSNVCHGSSFAAGLLLPFGAKKGPLCLWGQWKDDQLLAMRDLSLEWWRPHICWILKKSLGPPMPTAWGPLLCRLHEWSHVSISSFHCGAFANPMVSTLIRQCKIDQMCVTALHSQLAYFCPLEQKKGRCVSGPGQWKDDQYIYIIYIYISIICNYCSGRWSNATKNNLSVRCNNPWDQQKLLKKTAIAPLALLAGIDIMLLAIFLRFFIINNFATVTKQLNWC